MATPDIVMPTEDSPNAPVLTGNAALVGKPLAKVAQPAKKHFVTFDFSGAATGAPVLRLGERLGEHDDPARAQRLESCRGNFQGGKFSSALDEISQTE